MTDLVEGSTRNGFFPFPKVVCGKRASEMIVPPKEMSEKFSIRAIWTNYDDIMRKQ